MNHCESSIMNYESWLMETWSLGHLVMVWIWEVGKCRSLLLDYLPCSAELWNWIWSFEVWSLNEVNSRQWWWQWQCVCVSVFCSASHFLTRAFENAPSATSISTWYLAAFNKVDLRMQVDFNKFNSNSCNCNHYCFSPDTCRLISNHFNFN